jgi:hypothetical protein
MLSGSRNSFQSHPPSKEPQQFGRDPTDRRQPQGFIAAQYVSIDSLKDVVVNKQDDSRLRNEVEEADRKAAELRAEHANLMYQMEQLDQQINDMRKE